MIILRGTPRESIFPDPQTNWIEQWLIAPERTEAVARAESSILNDPDGDSSMLAGCRRNIVVLQRRK